MTRFVAALLVARGPVVKAQVDPRTPFAAALGQSRSAALLIRSVTRARRELTADEELEARLASALRKGSSAAGVASAGREAWHARQQRGES